MKLRRYILSNVCLIWSLFLAAQPNFDSILNLEPILAKVKQQKEKYHLQIIYSRVERSTNRVKITDYMYNVSDENYTYCASLVKLPVCILALKKLNELSISAESIMFTDSVLPCQQQVKKDTSSQNKYPSIEHYIKRMLVVSDNEAYNRVFEFLGTKYIHSNLSKLGYKQVRIFTRYELNCEPKHNLFTNPVLFYDSSWRIIYRQEAETISGEWSKPYPKILIGKSYRDFQNKLVTAPKDFSNMNYMRLNDAHQILKELLYPSDNVWNITRSQQKFIEEQMTLLPRQSKSPSYNSNDFPDNYKKYLFYGDFKDSIIDSNLAITNCVGQSYGFMSDCARFLDTKANVEFMLSAALYVNSDGILNDGKYEYKSIALPFLAALGREFYYYELKRKN